jgi:hypothetical protein
MIKGTVLYYAAGGGLGHLTRTLAIVSAMDSSSIPLRVLASSTYAGMAEKAFPCALDRVPIAAMSSRRAYGNFLDNYLSLHHVKALVLDTFPWGIAGEWIDRAADLPRYLIARSVRWESYLERTLKKTGRRPAAALIIEPVEEEYVEFLARNCALTHCNMPIINKSGFMDAAGGVQQAHDSSRYLVIHAGATCERDVLVAAARESMWRDCKADIPLDMIFPEQEIFPATVLFHRYTCIVSAAGYNMVAAASRSAPNCRHILIPFARRFDDQAARLRRFEAGLWADESGSGTGIAADWLMMNIACYI